MTVHHCHIVKIRGNSYCMLVHRVFLRPGLEQSQERQSFNACWWQLGCNALRPLRSPRARQPDQRMLSINQRVGASAESVFD